ncbi:MAG: hypothetical protein ACR2NZ_15045 [Rubripirellula sp.]
MQRLETFDSIEAAEIQLTESQQAHEDASGDTTVIDAVQANAQLLQELSGEITVLRSLLGSVADSAAQWQGSSSSDSERLEGVDDLEAELRQWQDECDRLYRRVLKLEDDLEETHQQNEVLASKLANQSVEAVASTPIETCESLSWEERKQRIMQQMDGDPSTLAATESSSDIMISGSQQSGTSGDRMHADMESRDREIAELRELLEQQSQTQGEGVAIRTAAIAEMLSDDELIQQERLRLQQLQMEWEEKFRAGEIEASLERAKLSRERQEVARHKVELEVQLERLHRELRSSDGEGGTRRWLTKLGLNDEA